MTKAKPGRRYVAICLLVLFILLIVVLSVTLSVKPETGLLGFDVSEHTFVELIQSWGSWGIAGSIGLMIVHSFIPFPAELLALANGMVYGIFWGSLITWCGAMLGAFLAFALARRLGRPFVERMVRERNWKGIDHWATRDGGIALLLSRLIPLIAFNLINYAAGMMKISWWTFTWATGLGILPLTLVMAVMGANMRVIPWWLWLLLAAVALLAWLGLQRLRAWYSVNGAER
jgi:uncharacterized membrane protein YdjX (TVP38/TMEM64 family)